MILLTTKFNTTTFDTRDELDIKMKKTKTEGPWNRSIAKSLLVKGLRDGSIPLENRVMSVRDVIELQPEFGGCDPDNIRRFSARLRNARKSIINEMQRRSSDKVMIEHDIALFRLTRLTANNSNRKIWHGSMAEKLLPIDIDNNMHLILQPMDLYNTRKEYTEFSLDVFRGLVLILILVCKNIDTDFNFESEVVGRYCS